MIFFKRHIVVTALLDDSRGVEKAVAKRVKMTHKNHVIVLHTKYGELRVKIEL
jgi:hypothetical protein